MTSTSTPMDIPATHVTGEFPRVYHTVSIPIPSRTTATNNDEPEAAVDIEECECENEQLKCCIISDPLSDKAAVAVCVMGGQLHDSVHGIAHLTEHMVFMGSTAFPNENEYDSYIQQYGGHSNAYTDLEQTVFYFDIASPLKLRGGLERLCGALSSPLLSQSSLERELQAVDAEHSKNITQDHWRTHQLSRTLLGCHGNHPYSNFGTGNKASLLEQVTKPTTGSSSGGSGSKVDEENVKTAPDVVVAEEVSTSTTTPDNTTTTTTKDETNSNTNNNNDLGYETLRKEIVAFYQRYYYAANMTLAILGPQSIAELQSMIEEIFIPQLPTRQRQRQQQQQQAVAETENSTITTTSTIIPPLPKREEVTIVQWVPLSGGDNAATLELQWIIQNDDNDPTSNMWYQYETKPTQPWLHLLGHEGPGSLLSALRELQWAQDLSTDDASGQTRSFSLFTMHIDLTVQGLQNVASVLHMIFYYIDIVLLLGKNDDDDVDNTISNDAAKKNGGGGIPDWVHDELKVTGDTAFRFLARHDAAMTVSSLSAHMHQYKPQHYLSGPYRILSEHHDSNAVRRIGTNTLSYQHNRGRNLLILLGSTEYDGTTDQVDPWYGTQYRIVSPSDTTTTTTTTTSVWEQFEALWKATLKNPTTNELDPSLLPSWASRLHLPARNDMLPTDFTLVSSHDEASTRFAPWTVPSATTTTTTTEPPPAQEKASNPPLPPPRCLLDTPSCRLWYKPDVVYQTPKANFMASFRSPALTLGSPETAVLSSLWVQVATELCNEFAYAASMAGLHCGFSDGNSGSMELTVSGYNHKAGILLQRICHTIRTVLPATLSSAKEAAADSSAGSLFFERMRNKLEHQYESALASAPYMHGGMAADLVLEACNRGTIQQRLVYLKDKKVLTSERLLHFSNEMLSCFHLEVLVHGNVMPDVATEWTNVILDAFQPSAPVRLSSVRGVQLPGATVGGNQPKECVYRLKGWNENDENNCVVNVYQVGLLDIPTNATMSVLLQLLREPAFNILRTEEQLGYIVFTSLKTTANNVKSLMFLIQSDSFDPLHVDERIEAFLSQFRSKILMQMSDTDFQANVNSFCESILEKSKNLGEESSKHWHVIHNRTYQFDRLYEIAKAAQRLTKLDVMRFFDHFVLAKSPYRRKLSVQLFGTAFESRRQELLSDNTTPEDVILISSPDDFVRNQALYPSQMEGCIDHLLLQDSDQKS